MHHSAAAFAVLDEAERLVQRDRAVVVVLHVEPEAARADGPQAIGDGGAQRAAQAQALRRGGHDDLPQVADRALDLGDGEAARPAVDLDDLHVRDELDRARGRGGPSSSPSSGKSLRYSSVSQDARRAPRFWLTGALAAAPR